MFLPARATAYASAAAGAVGAGADSSAAFQLRVYSTEYSGLTLDSGLMSTSRLGH